ncbi:MAG: trehalose-6-phosphate synthase [Acidimicrobiales bacterium]|nr:trehalose-6-phosphate synthase [Acidimicrobiales bacterium]
MAPHRPLVIVSNRGPVTFEVDADGQPVPRRGAGGLVSGLAPLVRGSEAVWIATALSEGDRRVARSGLTNADGFRVRLLDFDPGDLAAFYDEVCNYALWFTHHGLFDNVYEPGWPAGWVDGPWAAYRRVNEAFADAVARDAPADAVVLVQDYHLCLVAAALGDRRPDLHLVHFSHTPFATADMLAVLPAAVRDELLQGLAAFDACGFHTARWAADFDSCLAVAGMPEYATFVSPLGPDPDELAATLTREESKAAFAELDGLVGDRSFVVRVDRIELSKNLLRGFLAFETLLDSDPARRGRAVMGAFVYPSRTGVPGYERYRRAVEECVERINGRFATPEWTPILWDDSDDFPRSIAALARADAVLVNPIRDGLNLVAKEAVLVNERDAQLVLSPGAGAWAELGGYSWSADPFDVGATASALAAALDASPDERAERHRALSAIVSAHNPRTWLADQLTAAWG